MGWVAHKEPFFQRFPPVFFRFLSYEIHCGYPPKVPPDLFLMLGEALSHGFSQFQAHTRHCLSQALIPVKPTASGFTLNSMNSDPKPTMAAIDFIQLNLKVRGGKQGITKSLALTIDKMLYTPTVSTL
jgi:hypothetical protein